MKQQQKAEARAFCYLLLSKLVQYPDELVLAVLRGSPGEKLARAFLALPGKIAAPKLPPIGDETELKAAYVRLFEQAQPSPLHEFTYRRMDYLDITALLADIAAFYRALGVRAEQGERHDHLATELEFLGLCCQREGSAWAEDCPAEALTCQQIAGRFFSDHTSLFYDEACEALARSEHPLYEGVADLLRTFLKSEAAYFARQARGQIQAGVESRH